MEVEEEKLLTKIKESLGVCQMSRSLKLTGQKESTGLSKFLLRSPFDISQNLKLVITNPEDEIVGKQKFTWNPQKCYLL